jgi:Bifunctional DNA primase/polymerase, N-terminal
MDAGHLSRPQMPPPATSDAITGCNTLDAAVSAARRGWSVFPCRPGDKRPAVPSWEQRACSDPERVAQHWPDGANVGIACGPSRLVVLDLDTHGELPDEWQAEPGINDGRDVLAALTEWAGQPWPATYTVRTPSGGWHLYFTAPAGLEIRNSASLLGPQVDVRGGGGYVVGAGSAVGGRPYEVLDDQPPVPLPGWIAAMLTRQPAPPRSPGPRRGDLPARLAGLVHTVETAPQGQRNDALFWAACRAAEIDGAGRDESCAALLDAALTAGLPEREARKTIASAMGGTR